VALPANPSCRRWLLVALTVLNFLFLLGARSLNEPDEGRYAEVAREMIETGNWLVPHIWYVPHLDKPPLTYWAVAASMNAFGRNEWAVRLPLALAGLSGVWAAYLLGCALAGRRAGTWSALILQSALLYYLMARMLTTDMLLTQFIAWALYFFWRAWRSLDALVDADGETRARGARRSFGWQLAAWATIALGFLTKGPIALAVPLVALVALVLYRRHGRVRWQTGLLGALAGLMLFACLVTPWFVEVFQRVPRAFHYMVLGQVAGHVLGTTIKNRHGSVFYFFGILAVGFLPWTLLLGWLWRRSCWGSAGASEREAWVFLGTAVLFTFALFSFTAAKLPAYILPLFPPLAVLVAIRWFGGAELPPGGKAWQWSWRAMMLSPLALMAAVALLMRFLFGVKDQPWVWPMAGVAVVGLGVLAFWGRGWRPARCARAALVLALLNLWSAAAVIPTVETRLRGNQTLRPLAAALRREYRPGDRIACWGRLPEGLPFYAYPVINAAHRPFLGGIPFNRPPYEFPGNRKRFGRLILPDLQALARLLDQPARVLVVGFRGTLRAVQPQVRQNCRLLCQVGQWELFANR
jgi:4-amino-4-deoxy-L-arabinose transferase-like glycosyltransferase